MTATVRDVALLAKVSLGTVSNYLNDRKPIAPATRQRIDAAIEELAFVPNSASRIMRGQRSTAIGFVIPDAGNPFFAEVARGVEDVALDAGLVIVTCNTQGDPAREKHYLRALAEMRVTGALVTPTTESRASLEALRAAGAAVVLIDHPHQGLELSAVDVDDELGGELAMRHLIERGHRELLFVGGPDGAVQFDARYRGAQQAVAAAGLDPSTLRRIDATAETIAARAEVGLRILELDRRPTGIFAGNDLIALAVQTSLGRNGVHAPDDVAIVGYDDTDNAQLALVPLTTVRQPMYDIGREAARLLLDEAASGRSADRHIQFKPRLVVRESTGGTTVADHTDSSR